MQLKLNPMKKLLYPLIFLIYLSSCAQVNDNALGKMRNFKIKNGIKITLMSPIDSVREVIERNKYGEYFLKRGTFGGADAIKLFVNVDSVITNVQFFYDTVSTYEYEVELFNKHLGFVGTETKHKSVTIRKVKTMTWEDKSTSFELTEVREGKKWQLTSLLSHKPGPDCYDASLRGKVATCTADCRGLIGCDGKFYCNECWMHNNGIKRIREKK